MQVNLIILYETVFYLETILIILFPIISNIDTLVRDYFSIIIPFSIILK